MEVIATQNCIPTDIAVDRSTERVVIQWKDGHLSAYPFEWLRSKCPCAKCVRVQPQSGESDALPMMGSGIGKKSWKLRNMHMVGRYAVQIGWEDGHDTGIYSFEFLRSICQCDGCSAGAVPTVSIDP